MSDNTLSQIGQIAITVRDVEAAADFYEHKLGMQLLFKGPPGLAFFANGSVRLMLSSPEVGEFSPASSIVYYKVDDIDTGTNQLRERGVRITSEPRMITKMPDHELWMAFFEDLDGNPLALMEERR